MRPRLRDLAALPRRMARRFLRGAGESPPATAEKTAATTAALVKKTEKLDERISAIKQDVRALGKEVRIVKETLANVTGELRGKLIQYNLLLGRLSKLVQPARDGQTIDVIEQEAAALSSRTIPLTLDERTSPPGWKQIGDQPHPDADGREWLAMDACPMCGDPRRTVVNEWNKLVMMDKAPDAGSARYDYAICFGCGVGYATRRPFGARYRFLLENFGEVTNKHGGAAEFTNPLLNPYPLQNADRAELMRRAARGAFVSDHLGLAGSEYLDGLLKDRLENSPHLDLIGALVAPHRARVLEIRPRTGMISEGLRRLFGATVLAMPIWESQELLLKEVYGIDSLGLVDYDDFTIPDAGPFDLIICNHMLTHAVRPQRFFDEVRRALRPGGHIYFYNEPDDAEFLRRNQSIIATLNPLHMQTFDLKSFVRCLAGNELEVVFHRRHQLTHISLARRVRTTMEPMGRAEREARVAAYRVARDRAILALRGDLRARFADEWSQVVERSVAAGIAEFDEAGTLRLVRR